MGIATSSWVNRAMHKMLGTLKACNAEFVLLCSSLIGYLTLFSHVLFYVTQKVFHISLQFLCQFFSRGQPTYLKCLQISWSFFCFFGERWFVFFHTDR